MSQKKIQGLMEEIQQRDCKAICDDVCVRSEMQSRVASVYAANAQLCSNHIVRMITNETQLRGDSESTEQLWVDRLSRRESEHLKEMERVREEAKSEIERVSKSHKENLQELDTYWKSHENTLQLRLEKERDAMAEEQSKRFRDAMDEMQHNVTKQNEELGKSARRIELLTQ